MATIIENSESRAFRATKDDGSSVWLRVRRPNRRESELADLELSRVFNQSLLSELPPRSRLLRKLKESGMWTDADSEKFDSLRASVVRAGIKISELVKKKNDFKPENVEQLAAVEVAITAAEAEYEKASSLLIELRKEVDGMLGHTADAKAESAQRNFLICCVTELVKIKAGAVDEVGARMFSGTDEMLATTELGLLQRIVYEYITFNNSMSSEQAEIDEPDPTTTTSGAVGTPSTLSADPQ